MDFASLYNKMEEEAKAPDRFKQQSSFGDPNIYKITKDEEGCGSVTIRFLPSFNKDKTQLQTTILKKVHNLQWERLLPGKDRPEKRWKPEMLCPKSFNKDAECPICDYGWDKYNESKEDGEPKDVYDKYRQSFTNNEKILTNIMIIKDEKRPENNSKIFVFELSKTVYSLFQKEVEKIKEMDSEERKQMGVPENLTSFDPFNLMMSKNMVLKFKSKKHITQPSEYWGSSYFTNMFTAIASNIQEAEELVNKAFCLDDYNNPADVLNVDEMQEQLDYVLFKNTKKKVHKQEDTSGVNIESDEMQELAKKLIKTAPVVDAPKQEVPFQNVQVETPSPVVEAPVVNVEPQTATETPKTTEPNVEMSDEDFLKSLGV